MKSTSETEKKEDLCHVLLSVDKARWAAYQLSWSKMRQNDKKKNEMRSREVEAVVSHIPKLSCGKFQVK